MLPTSNGRNIAYILQLARSVFVQHCTAAGTGVATQICVVGKLLFYKLVDCCLQFSTVLFYLLGF
jgi:hypothetical protein